MSELAAVAISDRHIYAVDQSRDRLLQFHLNGAFSRQVGGIGQAPFEYQRIADVQVTADGLVIVVDSYSGKLVFYREDGSFEACTTHPSPVPRGAMAMLNSRQFVFSDYFPKDDSKTFAICDYSTLKKPSVLATFDTYPAFALATKVRLPYTSLAVVGSEIWTSNPYHGNMIDIWNSEGDLLNQAAVPGIESRYEDFLSSEIGHNLRHELIQQERVHKITAVGNIVIVDTLRRLWLFNKKGELVARPIPAVQTFWGAHGDYVVTEINFDSPFVYKYLEQKDPMTLSALIDSEFNLNDWEKQNSALRFGRLLQDKQRQD